MKIALVHDYIKEYGGAERVLEALHELFPEAPVYTTVYLPDFLGPHRKRFEIGSGKWEVRTSWLQHLPFKAKLISPIRLIAPWVFSRFDFSEFDAVIVSATGAYTSNAIQVKSQKLKVKNTIQNSKFNHEPSTMNHQPIHICYCHTPPRYLYGYATARDWKNNLVFRVLGEIANHFLRMVDFKSAQNVDYFIANSKNIAGRIEKFYRRESVVIYPPVTMIHTDLKTDLHGLDQQKSVGNQRKSYYVCGGRLAKPKNIDLIIKTCEEMGLPLKVFGKGFAGAEKEILRYQDTKIQRDKEIKEKTPNVLISQYPNIEYLGEVSDEEKLELMRNAKAYIFAAIDEDFGITPVEAMSVGTQVIAYRSGGVCESVVDQKTGLFFDELTIESLSKAIEQLNSLTIKPEDCIKQAEKFSKNRFKKEILDFVKKHYKASTP